MTVVIHGAQAREKPRIHDGRSRRIIIDSSTRKVMIL
jgi:hypothetical protein